MQKMARLIAPLNKTNNHVIKTLLRGEKFTKYNFKRSSFLTLMLSKTAHLMTQTQSPSQTKTSVFQNHSETKDSFKDKRI